MDDLPTLQRLEASLIKSLRDWEGSERGDALLFALSQVREEIARSDAIGCNQCGFNTCMCDDSPNNPETEAALAEADWHCGYHAGYQEARFNLIAKIEGEARRYAAMYPDASDGRSTFFMFADWVSCLPSK